jgi:hypothetical protein
MVNYCTINNTVQHILTIWVTWLVSYKRLIIRENPSSHHRFLVGFVLLIFLVFWVVLCFCVKFVFILCVVCPILPVSLDCPFLIAPLVFSNVYFTTFFSILISNISLHCQCIKFPLFFSLLFCLQHVVSIIETQSWDSSFSESTPILYCKKSLKIPKG